MKENNHEYTLNMNIEKLPSFEAFKNRNPASANEEGYINPAKDNQDQCGLANEYEEEIRSGQLRDFYHEIANNTAVRNAIEELVASNMTVPLEIELNSWSSVSSLTAVSFEEPREPSIIEKTAQCLFSRLRTGVQTFKPSTDFHSSEPKKRSRLGFIGSLIIRHEK